ALRRRPRPLHQAVLRHRRRTPDPLRPDREHGRGLTGGNGSSRDVPGLRTGRGMNKAGGGLEPNVSFDPSNESSPRWGCMGPMVRFSALASATLVVLALAACSSSSTPQPTLSASVKAPASPSAAPQPAGSADCATVASAADVSAIVGETVTGPSSASSGKAIPGLTATGCDYTAADGTVAFSFGTGPNQSIVQTVFQQSKQAQGAQTV